MNSSYTSPTTKPIYRGTQVVWYILGIIEVLLAFRFVLKLLGANAAAGFTSFIYNVTYIFAAPFLSVFRSTRVVEGSVFEWTTLLAMVVYWVVAAGIIKLLLMGRTVSTPEAAVKLDHQDPNTPAV
ncbi:MAG: YggT family protein [Patescibacteria group bacterium]